MANALQIGNLVMSLNSYTLGDTLQTSFTAKNVVGYKITTVFPFDLRYKTGSSGIYLGELDYPETSVSWSNGKTRSFNQTWQPDTTARANIAQIFSDPTVRAVPVTLVATVYYTQSGHEYGAGDEVAFGYLMNKRYAPVINGFSVVRWAQTNPDESDKVRVTLDIDTVDGTYFSDMSVRLYYSTGAVSTSSSYVDLTSQISNLVGAGEVDLDLTQTFGTGDSWNFMLVFGDSYENVTAYASVPNTFANMHLAGFSTGGVAFGKFSSSTQGNPLFECEYPAVFGGDAVIGEGKLIKVVTITGAIPQQSVAAGGYVTVRTPLADLANAIGTGWIPIAVAGWMGSMRYAQLYQCRIDTETDELAVSAHNPSTSARTFSVDVDLLCLHTALPPLAQGEE